MVRAVVFPQLNPPPSVFVAREERRRGRAPRPVEGRCAVGAGIGFRQHDLTGLVDGEPDGTATYDRSGRSAWVTKTSTSRSSK
jgi:hypothetical protein